MTPFQDPSSPLNDRAGAPRGDRASGQPPLSGFSRRPPAGDAKIPPKISPGVGNLLIVVILILLLAVYIFLTIMYHLLVMAVSGVSSLAAILFGGLLGLLLLWAALLSAAAIAGAVAGPVMMLSNYAKVLREPRPQARPAQHAQPARLLAPFRHSFRQDGPGILAASASRNYRSASRIFYDSPLNTPGKTVKGLFSVVFWLLSVSSLWTFSAAMLCGSAAGLAALALIHLLAVVALYCLAILPARAGLSALAGLLRLAERFRAKSRGLTTICPACYTSMLLPVYLCSGCERTHSRLQPNRYGLLRRRCECDQTLASSSLTGRQHLKARCPHCAEGIPAAESRAIRLALAGSASAGKTSFRLAATHLLSQTLSGSKAWSLAFFEPHLQQSFDKQIADLQAHIPPGKTSRTLPRAFGFQLSGPRQAARLIEFYDSSGEAYQSAAALAKHHYYEHFDGLIFVIDPFCLSDIAAKYSEQEGPAGQRRENVDDIFDRLLIHLEGQGLNERSSRLQQPCAVLLSKVDLFDFDRLFGLEATHRLVSQEPGLSLEEAADHVCREFLASQGHGGLLQKLSQKFTHLRFFACNSLDLSRPAAEDCQAHAPLLWLLERKGLRQLSPSS